MIVAKDAPFLYRFLQRVIWIVVRVIVRPGCDRRRARALSGPLVCRAIIFTPWTFRPSASPSRAGRQCSPPTSGGASWAAGSWSTRHAVIYVARGEADREAMNQALAVLRRRRGGRGA